MPTCLDAHQCGNGEGGQIRPENCSRRFLSMKGKDGADRVWQLVYYIGLERSLWLLIDVGVLFQSDDEVCILHKISKQFIMESG